MENKRRNLYSITCIERLRKGDKQVLKEARWLMYLAVTSQENINLERLHSMEEKRSSYLLEYVERTLRILECLEITEEASSLVEETLIWSEVAKGGTDYFRKRWLRDGINLFVHNRGSAEIYLREASKEAERRKHIIHTLISTHGLIGQYLRGEVSVRENLPLIKLVSEGFLTKERLTEVLKALNSCIISGVDTRLWERVRCEAEGVIESIVNEDLLADYDLKERLRRLRKVSIENGEDFDTGYDLVVNNNEITDRLTALLRGRDLWFVESALYDFTLEEFVKILLLIGNQAKEDVKHISFEQLMKDIYYQHEGQKRINIYKKRIIENYLSAMPMKEILSGNYRNSLHVSHSISIYKELDGTLFFNFEYSPAGEKLIEFCVEAEKADVLYESAVVLLFDLFGLRKDKYDRFYEEETYLKTMNQSIDYKKIILDYIKGEKVIDIGPGGGALMDLIEENAPGKLVTGIDIAQNVLDSLKRKKQVEDKKWEVMYGDALNLSSYLPKDSIDTIIFCSILHELFSYIEYEGRKFNYDTLAAAFVSAFEVLKPGGRIIIRDGIMTEEKEEKRIIRFLSHDGMEFLKRYTADFKGREIGYEVIGQNEVKLPVNDAMEFLYTYTWGEKSYVHEVNEQFGYFTPGEYLDFIKKVLGERAKIITIKHFLQEGYTVALSQKIELFDEERKPARLPDSTCLVVVEKVR
ncbi:class I SAM-dependent methyltransferase [Anaerocolumna xylanovorans]|uniref:Methyltransferase domain-containing protein n=1 Tax=Anaerocolumna xylanovorans DSM 12503 TaxID=1121345 RepID=A0A1M7Y2G0_9FIRM|nr:class I SAM-dependent methyltransferase [Anaerocolumna xylanovorans]SHO46138.1 Methyltransferase domain-containing protein [Anaerocolumna xylanovorans DSM 12503]